MTPAISVVMPVRDGKPWIDQSIESLLAQDFNDFELLVVDDGSRDGTESILEAFSRMDHRIRVIHQAPQGIVAALNRAIMETRAPYLARLDADDRASRDRLALQYSFMEGHAEVVLLGSAAEVIDASGAIIGHRSPPVGSIELARVLCRYNPFIHSSVMTRTALVRKLGGYRVAFLFAEDYDLWLRMAELGPVANVPEYLIQYRNHSANLSRAHAVRQSFSARLAQRSAIARRSGHGDPAIGLLSPPNWYTEEAESSFFSEDVGLYRFLDSDLTSAASYVAAVRRRFFKLNRIERRLAQLRLRQLFAEFGCPVSLRHLEMLALFAMLHPPRAFRLALESIKNPNRNSNSES
jgi:glycosyltransferase involved in cell wall biosynthesis